MISVSVFSPYRIRLNPEKVNRKFEEDSVLFFIFSKRARRVQGTFHRNLKNTDTQVMLKDTQVMLKNTQIMRIRTGVNFCCFFSRMIL